MTKKKIKRKQEIKRLRKSAKMAVMVSFTVACSMLCVIGAELFINGTFLGGVKEVSTDVAPINVTIPSLETSFKESLLKAGFNLFQTSVTKEENMVIAPYTSLMALGMLENGAAEDTFVEIQKLLGDFSLGEINSGYTALHKKLKEGESACCDMHSSIWLRKGEGIAPREYFLKANATYYEIDIMMTDFTKENTLNKMNKWFKENTLASSKESLMEVKHTTSIMVMSTANFQGVWEVPYRQSDILGGEFQTPLGEVKQVSYMYSKENYLETSDAEGFIKPYKGGKYSFVAVRPTKDMSIYEYLSQLDSEALKKVIHSKSTQKAIVAIPKFTYDEIVSLKVGLKGLGLMGAFHEQKANFGKLFENGSSDLYLSDIVQKSYIKLDEMGVNSNEDMEVTSHVIYSEEDTQKDIVMDSPFLFVIIENETDLPIIMGIIENPDRVK